MNKKDLETELTLVQQDIKAKQLEMDVLATKEQELKDKLKSLQKQDESMLNATNLWCRLSNAIIAKYKPMAEENPKKAIQELTRIEGALISGKFLVEEELEKAL